MSNDKAPKRVIEKSIQLDFGKSNKRETYSDFLQLDVLLNLQETFTDPPQRDELLFLMIHQVAELWLKLAYFELGEIRNLIQQDDLNRTIKGIGRVKAIQEQLINSWKVLLTMTPSDYKDFRDALGQSSGFQSWGYRLVEYIMGNRDSSYLAVHKHDQAVTDKLNAELNQLSIYDEVIHMLSRQGFDVPDDILNRDHKQSYVSDPRIVEIWHTIYSNQEEHWALYNLGESLMDMETLFQQWRFSHVRTVERIIGGQSGTGGSSGVEFLERALKLKCFPDLYALRDRLLN
ncbi:MAG: tryptophan 2,3-dioxygenase family protein [Rhizobiaceae bacterium]